MGWLVLFGRRGHYEFCDELRAYDLDTGSAHVVRSCSGLALNTNGSVNGPLTRASRRAERLEGTLPIDALREAALMTILARRVEDDVVVGGRGIELPAGVDRVVTLDDVAITRSGNVSFSSAQTTLRWFWITDGCVRTFGYLTWPDDYVAGVDYADELIAIAEGGLAEGRAPAPFPEDLHILLDDPANPTTYHSFTLRELAHELVGGPSRSDAP
jgi:hypothetical protein